MGLKQNYLEASLIALIIHLLVVSFCMLGPSVLSLDDDLFDALKLYRLKLMVNKNKRHEVVSV